MASCSQSGSSTVMSSPSSIRLCRSSRIAVQRYGTDSRITAWPCIYRCVHVSLLACSLGVCASVRANMHVSHPEQQHVNTQQPAKDSTTTRNHGPVHMTHNRQVSLARSLAHLHLQATRANQNDVGKFSALQHRLHVAYDLRHHALPKACALHSSRQVARDGGQITLGCGVYDV